MEVEADLHGSQPMESSVGVLSVVASCVMVFGGALPYLPQYQEIQRSNDTTGFSTRVCLVLLLANILRIFFWVGKQFELPLLLQSVVMISTMFCMLRLCCHVHNSNRVSTKQHRLSGTARAHLHHLHYTSITSTTPPSPPLHLHHLHYTSITYITSTTPPSPPLHLHHLHQLHYTSITSTTPPSPPSLPLHLHHLHHLHYTSVTTATPPSPPLHLHHHQQRTAERGRPREVRALPGASDTETLIIGPQCLLPPGGGAVGAREAEAVYRSLLPVWSKQTDLLLKTWELGAQEVWGQGGERLSPPAKWCSEDPGGGAGSLS
ncbi:unnamed protein product [Arctogadus glacialis]